MLSYKLDKSERLKQSYAYIANTVLKLSEENKSKIICFTSSLNDKNDKHLIMKNICKILKSHNKKVLLLNTDEYAEKISNLHDKDVNKFCKEELKKELDKALDDYDLILLNLAPVRLFANAVEYARLSDGVVLVERYLYTKYKDYEETLLKLKQNDVKIFGVVTYK